MSEFRPFPKLPRLSRGCVITEKIDGTNASVYIEPGYADEPNVIARLSHNGTDYNIRAGSRTRWIKPGDDNFGFASWVKANAEELIKLGEGHHFGEWWGQGIQRGYGYGMRVFSLFNVGRWIDGEHSRRGPEQQVPPPCCSVVPMLSIGPFSDDIVDEAIARLALRGSYAAPGFMDPEGIVIFHAASGHMFKKTIKGDESPKGKS